MFTPTESSSLIDRARIGRFFAKVITRRTAAIVGGGALVFGIVLGSGTMSASNSAEIRQLTSKLETAESASAQLVAEAELLEKDNERIRASESTKTGTINKLKGELVVTQLDVQAHLVKISELEAALAAAAAVAARPAPIAAPASPQNAYYKNCTAARNAGAAPVRRGAPGYGPHLDRDGDGVGCE